MIYTILFSDKALGKSLRGKNSALIVACVGCANNSVAYETGLPVYKVEFDYKTGNRMLVPHAIISEAERIKRFLGEKGVKAEIEMNDACCMVTGDQELAGLMGNPMWIDAGFKDRASSYDSVLVLACRAGVNGIKGRVGEKPKVHPGMLTVGIQQS